MKNTFKLQEFPHSNFEIETSIWTGKTKLFMNNTPIERSKEKGKPFLIPSNEGIVKAYPKPSFMDPVAILEINGNKTQIVEKLKWFEYAIGGLPLILLAGGALGAVIGILGTAMNFGFFRQGGSEIAKYAKVIGGIIVSYLIYFIIAIFILKIL